jgi:hypothetical protein
VVADVEGVSDGVRVKVVDGGDTVDAELDGGPRDVLMV